MDVPPYILKFKFFFKNTCSTVTVWIHVSILQSKSKMIHIPIKVIKHIFYSAVNISKKGIIMKILKKYYENVHTQYVC